jgi:EmrB/QacA subfamily drug resistance transporter
VFAKRPCEDIAHDKATADGPAGGIWVLVAAIVGSSMSMIDGTAVNVALPIMQRELGATAAGVQWVVEGYLLFLSALILIGGSLGDRLGRKLVFGTGIAIFALASIWCGLAHSIGQLIVARCVQGIGGALATPGSLALISASFSGEARGRAIGTWSGFSAITTAAGPVLGGWLAQNVSWRAVFFLNVPLAALVLVVLALRVRESRDAAASHNIDVAGATLATLALGTLVYGLTLLQGGALDPVGLGASLAGLLLLALFVYVERAAREPMIRLDLFASRTFTVTNLYTFLLYATLGGALFFVPFDLINVQGYSPSAAGAAFLPFILIMFAFSRFSGGLVARVGARMPLAVGAFVAGLGFIAYAFAGVGRSYWVSFFPAAAILGIGGALFVAPLTTAVMDSVDSSHAGVASGINNAVARTAGLIAIAVLGIALATAFERQLTAGLAQNAVTPATLASVARDRASIVAGRVPSDITDVRQRAIVRRQVDRAFTSGFRAVMFISAGLAWLAALIAFVALPLPERRARKVGTLPSRETSPA